MNELEQQLSTLLKKSLEVAEATGHFAVEQAPLILQEFYNWHIFKYSAGMALGVFLILIGWNVRKLWGKKVKSGKEAGWGNVVIGTWESEDVTTFTSLLMGIGSGLFILFVNAYYLAFILVSPKLYLIEYFIK